MLITLRNAKENTKACPCPVVPHAWHFGAVWRKFTGWKENLRNKFVLWAHNFQLWLLCLKKEIKCKHPASLRAVLLIDLELMSKVIWFSNFLHLLWTTLAKFSSVPLAKQIWTLQCLNFSWHAEFIIFFITNKLWMTVFKPPFLN